MKKGALIFAHNSREIDYILLAVISGGLAKKNLKIPVSLVTDEPTLQWARDSGIFDLVNGIFEKIIEVKKPRTENKRNLYDGANKKSIPFNNTNRCSAFDLTPYDRTLLLDSDFLIFSDRLLNYFDVDKSIMIADSMNDICNQNRLGFHDRYISDVAPKLYWATTVIFSKDKYSKMFFDLVDYIKSNYQYYADLFRFDHRQFRNDIAFSIAKHILEGFETQEELNLPSLLTVQDKDILYDVSDNKLTFLISPNLSHEYVLASTSGVDLHIMNKQSIIRNKDRLLDSI